MSNNISLIFLGLFTRSLIIGLLTVFTPFIYAILPITVGYLAPKSKPKAEGRRNVLTYALSLIIIFTAFGGLISAIIGITGLNKVTAHWLFNFFLFRLFFGLGLSLIGAFDFKLPEKWSNPSSKAMAGSFLGIFRMALTLPVVSFSSTLPLALLVVLMAMKTLVIGPAISMFGFSIGMALPFVFPGMLKAFVSSKSLLNNVKVLMGFLAMAIGLKFLSYADISLGWHILDRDIFIMILMLLATVLGLYMLGMIQLPKDFAAQQNSYGVEYITMTRLFIAIALFTFVIYLLPGIWGAPLHGVSSLLPPP